MLAMDDSNPQNTTLLEAEARPKVGFAAFMSRFGIRRENDTKRQEGGNLDGGAVHAYQEGNRVSYMQHNPYYPMAQVESNTWDR